jgi:hypothetical protein
MFPKYENDRCCFILFYFYLVLKIINKNEEIKEVNSQWKVILIMNYDVVKCTTLMMMTGLSSEGAE